MYKHTTCIYTYMYIYMQEYVECIYIYIYMNGRE